MPAISIERLTVRADRVVADVRVASAARMTTPALAALVRQAFPLVEHHACVNEKGSTFGAVMAATPLPHLLEHLVIDLQTRAACSPDEASRAAQSVSSAHPDRLALTDGHRFLKDFTYVGTTQWTDEAAGRARVEVNFTDDLVALRAFRDATGFLNDAVVI